MLYAAILAGHVDARFQGSKPQPKSRVNWHPNDGRAPDTRERLAAIEKIEGEFNAQTSALNEAERWKACNSAPVTAPAAPSQSSTPPTELMRQSYIWDANSCFIDAPLEAYFRAFIAMGDAVRGQFLRRIRADAPHTGLRDVFEHLWLRGLLSGTIVAPSSTVSKPSQEKLGHALFAGQRNVKRLIETKWDGGEFAAGMAGCSRTWLNQMVQTETTRDIQKYFGICRTLRYTCEANHLTLQPHPEISFESGVHHGDMFIAQQHMPAGSHQTSLDVYLTHAIPRQRYGMSRADTNQPLHHALPIVCSNPTCNAGDATLTSVSTEWPLILRVAPITHSRDLARDTEGEDIACPLVLKLGADVEYNLIARVVFIPPQGEGGVGHYITKTRLKNNTYLYNDLRRNGLLNELGPLQLLEDYEAKTSFVLYLRTSRACRTSRSTVELQADLDKIPKAARVVIGQDEVDASHRQKEVQIAGKTSSQTTTNSNAAPPDDEITQMLIDSITSPVKGVVHPSAPTPSSDRFYTPEQSPAPTKDPNAPANRSPATTNSTTPCPVHCVPCGVTNAEGDDDPNEVQCVKCRYWSHFRCYPEADWNDPTETFYCRPCREQILLEFYEPGAIVMLPMPGENWQEGALWYPAKFIKWHKNRPGQTHEYEFEWLECNDGTVYNTEFSSLPVQILRTYFRDRKFLKAIRYVSLTEKMIGTIRLPFYMKPNENHKNPALTPIFEAALPKVVELLAAWEHSHPVVHSFKGFTSMKPKRQKAGEWLEALGLVPTAELEVVLSPHLLALLKHDGLAELTEDELTERVLGVGSAFLQILAVQHELGEPLNLNGDLVHDLWDDSVVPNLSRDGEAAIQGMFGTIENFHTLPGRTTEERIARFARNHTEFDPALRPPTFRRIRPSLFPTTPAISVPLPARLKRKLDDGVPDGSGPKKRAKAAKDKRKRVGATSRVLRSATKG